MRSSSRGWWLVALATLAIGSAAPPDQGLLPVPVGDVRTLPGPQALYGDVAITRDGTRIVAGDAAQNPVGFRDVFAKDDGVVRVWDMGVGGPARELRGRTMKVRHVAISPDGGRIAASGPTRSRKLNTTFDDIWLLEGDIIQTWEVASGRQLATIEPTGLPYALAFGPDGATVAAVVFGDEAEYAVWEAESGRLVQRLGGPGQWNMGLRGRGPEVVVAFGPNLRQVTALDLSRYNTVRLWEPGAGTFWDLKWDRNVNIDSFALSPAGQSVAWIDAEQVVTIATIKNRTVLRTGQRPVPPEPNPFVPYSDSAIRPLVLAYDSSGAKIVAGIADGSLRIYDAATAEVVAVVRGPLAPVRALAFVGDRIRVVAGGRSIPIGGMQKPTPLLVWEAEPPVRSENAPK